MNLSGGFSAICPEVNYHLHIKYLCTEETPDWPAQRPQWRRAELQVQI